MPFSYEAHVRFEVFRLMESLPVKQNTIITQFIQSLESNPFQDGDCRESDDAGRPIEVKILGDLLYITGSTMRSEIRQYESKV